MKWQRNYQITITNPDGDRFIIKPPFTVKITTNATLTETPNQATIKITNLGSSTQNALHKDKFANDDRWPVEIKCGYQDRLYLIFLGNIREAYSERIETDWITTLDIFDGEFAMQKDGQISESLSRGGDLNGIIASSAQDLNINIGWTLKKLPVSRRGMVNDGTIKDLLDMTVPGGWFIDKEELYIIGKSGIVGDIIFKIDPEQLLSTPRKRDRCVECTTLFYPQLAIGRYLELICSISQYNGKYQVAEVGHNFTWSGADGGEATTTVSLFIPQYTQAPTLYGTV